VCQREINMTPGQLVNRLRVEAAQQMIGSSSLGLKEIANACGFGSVDSMRRIFQQALGITAAEYVQRFKRAR
jgi:transcriptional regulator GlxA family with amidase domain